MFWGRIEEIFIIPDFSIIWYPQDSHKKTHISLIMDPNEWMNEDDQLIRVPFPGCWYQNLINKNQKIEIAIVCILHRKLPCTALDHQSFGVSTEISKRQVFYGYALYQLRCLMGQGKGWQDGCLECPQFYQTQSECPKQPSECFRTTSMEFFFDGYQRVLVVIYTQYQRQLLSDLASPEFQLFWYN